MKKTLHFKKHKNCNLFCEGCISSTQNNNINSITETDNDSILQTMTLINQSTNPNEEIKYSISFLGGEPLLRKEDLTYYKNFITNNQEIISDYGIQTNLVFSDDILEEIIENKTLFSHRLGTSYNFNHTRMWQGSHKKFKEKFLKNYQILSKELDYNLPIIVVTTPNNVKDMYKIYSLLNKHKIDVTFFHFLPMGKKTSYFTYYEKEEGFFDEFADNLLKINQDIDKQVIVQPIDKIVETVKYKTEYGCGMQQDCFKQSFCVEADGNIFICPELSAQNKYPLGNWKTREVYNENINLLKKRMTRVDNDCLKCNYYQYCKSGCMAESLASGGDLFQKTYMCRSWKRIFKYLIDSQPHK